MKNNPFNLSTIGERFAKIRTDYDLTQQEMAEKMGLAREKMSQIETGRRRLTDTEIAFIATTFVDVDLYWFVLGDDLSR